ncbi:MAG: UDP-N-acetylglucosamine--N-acetylmuramyl-(pentapeptide) pyrophosphoryl-undecaprenol N-acetylglucosamine transferase [Candidatus Melainabacteria bacterium]|jgi:UDP-N-acetylglucosamine--N-acetylmuramyl-(pentapeptide) pyrophosphoryl-undecaprenol N-acetylglucosamine transferase|nr:UDP-N-acetylglucosamine--N-acetylmuramyl-(pentapeptide) pyrophosphoryl-undecaprenol N-acetylglucosamine transferase [Candidatus Melainabacteria bacterium]
MAQFKKIALTGGGTGGHIYPCLALAEAILEQKPATKLFYIGHEAKLEAELLNKDELKDAQGKAYSSYIKFLGLVAYPLPRSKNPFDYLKFAWRFWDSVQKASAHLKENKIDAVFGTGGYVAAPAFAAAILNKIPYIIHNLDAHMGLANLTFVKDAAVLTLGFPDLKYLKSKVKSGKVVVSGNPISMKFSKEGIGNRERGEGKRFNILITGGSQGAESINEAIGRLLPRLSENNKINVIHVAGSKLYQEYVEKFLDGDLAKYANYKVVAYTHQMPQLCAHADIAICRSGAMTIAEMAASGVVPIFIPLPWAAHDHQTLNAKSLVDAEAALMLKQDEPDFDEHLYASIEKLVEDIERLELMQTKLALFAKPGAAGQLAKLVLKIAK